MGESCRLYITSTVTQHTKVREGTTLMLQHSCFTAHRHSCNVLCSAQFLLLDCVSRQSVPASFV